ncbi:FAD-dependent oxidoreductase [uncultured Phenylobacterium sp.]|uniref:FAD-dependent oxidoreductase n=1 Tax=uncultured Phenylobacterium sp. TaxID=349273 RepID=UPI0025EB6577|nr:FAD-dependent oxidoreductase [uncultured Phenylobacterium sp.]
MSGAPKVTIAGAGVLGLASALALAEAGCAVTVFDPGAGPNASTVAAGMIAPVFEAVLDPAARSHLDLLMAGRDRWPGLAQRTGVVLDRSGAIAVGDDAWLARVTAGLDALGLRGAEIGRATALALAPGLSDRMDHAILTREDWRVDPEAALPTLRAAAAARGVAFRIEAVTGRGDADVLVIATGATTGLADVAPELVELSPIKGHIVRFPGPVAGVTVRTEGAYAAPGQGGLAVGATMEPGRADTLVDFTVAAPLLAAGVRLFPALRDGRFEIAAGVRGATPDGLPMAGWSKASGVVLAVGARRNGWLLAPLVAEVVAACVTGRDAGPYGARLDPARFGTGRSGGWR